MVIRFRNSRKKGVDVMKEFARKYRNIVAPTNAIVKVIKMISENVELRAPFARQRSVYIRRTRLISSTSSSLKRINILFSISSFLTWCQYVLPFRWGDGLHLYCFLCLETYSAQKERYYLHSLANVVKGNVVENIWIKTTLESHNVEKCHDRPPGEADGFS